MRAGRAFALSFAVASALLACGSENAPSTSSSSSGAGVSSSAGTGGSSADPTPSESCVRPGDKGNNKGVGEYCTPVGSECSEFPEAALCLAKVGQDQWFCTRIGCKAGDDCGTGATCLIDKDGSACVPDRCTEDGAGGAGGTGGAGGAGGSI